MPTGHHFKRILQAIRLKNSFLCPLGITLIQALPDTGNTPNCLIMTFLCQTLSGFERLQVKVTGKRPYHDSREGQVSGVDLLYEGCFYTTMNKQDVPGLPGHGDELHHLRAAGHPARGPPTTCCRCTTSSSPSPTTWPSPSPSRWTPLRLPASPLSVTPAQVPHFK